MSSGSQGKITRLRIGELPILLHVATRLGVVQVFEEYFPTQSSEKIPCHLSLLLAAFNIASARDPMYELGDWVGGLHPRIFGFKTFPPGSLNDDRFARALDRLYHADRSSMQTAIVMSVTSAANLDLTQLHNDSTSVKACGKISGETASGFRLARGHSKDHRPDLKQLVYSLTITADGGVPVHYKTYPGNTTDDTTHIETWQTLTVITGRKDFLYVADCKVCTDKQLDHITVQGGRVITVVPKTWKEVADFRDRLRNERMPKRRIARKKLRKNDHKCEVYSVFSVDCLSYKRNFPIYWLHSSAKRDRDRTYRREQLEKTEQALGDLAAGLNRRNLKTKKQIDERLQKTLRANGMQKFIETSVSTIEHHSKVQVGKGRPGPDTEYRTTSKSEFRLSFRRIKTALQQEERIDGVFPLLCTDEKIKAKEALAIYKYQPCLEKRFSQFKSIHRAAPLLFKRIERVESMMFLFFVALILQAYIERQLRIKMTTQQIEAIPLYPEHRLSTQPTTARVFDRFEQTSVYHIDEHGTRREYRDQLTKLQRQLLSFLEIDEATYWPRTA